jgi:hypothetical protein
MFQRAVYLWAIAFAIAKFRLRCFVRVALGSILKLGSTKGKGYQLSLLNIFLTTSIIAGNPE